MEKQLNNKKLRSRRINSPNIQTGINYIDEATDQVDLVKRLLFARGFLLEREEDTLYWRRDFNADHWFSDEDYLGKFLEKLNIGSLVQDGRIVLSKSINVQPVINYFAQFEGEGEAGGGLDDWNIFKSEINRHEIYPVGRIDPYAAALVKALWSCSIRTSYSCSGIHLHEGSEKRKFKVFIYHGYNEVWATLVVKKSAEAIGREFSLTGFPLQIDIQKNPNRELSDVLKLAEHLYSRKDYWTNIKAMLINMCTKENVSIEEFKEISMNIRRSNSHLCKK